MEFNGQPIKFLIIRFSSIGDIVLTTPVIRNLKKQAENAEVHFLTKKVFAPILEENPYVDKLHKFDGNFKLLIKELKEERFDYIIDLHNNLRTKRVQTALKLNSISYNKLNYKKWLLVNFKINKLPNLHIVDRYMSTIRFFIEEYDRKGLDYFIPEKDKYKGGLPPEYHVVVIGANHFTKQLPDSKLAELCMLIQKPVVFLGGTDDILKAKAVEKIIDKKVINLVGKLNINQSASVVKNAEWIVTPDTGIMHIAAAFEKKIISLWGNTVPQFGMTAYMADSSSRIMEQKGLKCRPCSKIGFKDCPKKHFKCMNDHGMPEIANIVNS